MKVAWWKVRVFVWQRRDVPKFCEIQIVINDLSNPVIKRLNWNDEGGSVEGVSASEGEGGDSFPTSQENAKGMTQMKAIFSFSRRNL